MKIAVLNNFMDNIGGAEIVTLTLVRELNADLYTTSFDEDKIKKMGFGDTLPRIYSLGHIPKKAPFRQQLAFWKFRRLNLSGKYDFFVIAGDWAMSGAVHNHPNMWYIHSPLNELWEFKDFIKKELLESWKILPYDIWVWFNRILTLKYAKSVDVWVCNSENTKKRTKKYYNKEAAVINPPVDTSLYAKENKSGNYWLSVNRLLFQKRVEIQIEAFRLLPDEKLVIVGSYEKGVVQFESYKNYIDKIKPANVEIINWVDNKRLKELYMGCKGFITTSMNEDFGMSAIEAMAAGKPVIAPNEGGYRESVLDGINGKLIYDINGEKVAQAVRYINRRLSEDPLFYFENCARAAVKFDTAHFMAAILKSINSHISL